VELLDDKYQIEQLLGEGGMGAVYRATHLGTKRTVAVKVIHPRLSSHDEFVARFRREAEAAGRLRHPNVVDVTDFGFAVTVRGPVAYLVMEYLDGCTLAEVLIEEGALPLQWAIDILEQTCSAVEEAHRAGIIHRDLKPDNIWLEPNRRGGYTVKVLDFGLVKLGEADAPANDLAPTRKDQIAQSMATEIASTVETDTLIRSATEDQPTRLKSPARKATDPELEDTLVSLRSPVDSNGQRLRAAGTAESAHALWDSSNDENLTRVGSVMGTPFYMSPEQCRGERLDSRSDIYSLGVVAYRLLTGDTPFQGTPEELIELHKSAEPPAIREKNRKVPRRIGRLVMSALAKDPAARPQSAAGFASSLRAAWEGPGHLLRHAFALYSQHFPTFLKISLLAYAPLILLLGLLNLPQRFIDMERMMPMMQMSIGVLEFAAMVAAILFAYFAVSAATVPVVVQLMIAPLRTVSLSMALAALKRRWLIFAGTSLLVMMMILFATVFLVVPGLIVAIVYALYAPVAIMETLGIRATLRRARNLSRRAWTTVLIITMVQFTLPLLVWRASVTTSVWLKLNDDYSPKEFSFNFSTSGRSALYQLFNIFVTPLTAIMISLLYLKTRQAGGESLAETSEQVEALDIPRSRWQLRMRARSTPSYTRRGATKRPAK
jgi:serine/threonine protein kinase